MLFRSLGIFGSGALAKEEYPVITLMGMVKIPGDFLKRLDAVMVGGWFFTLYALIGTTLFYGVVIARRALTSWQAGGAKDEEDRKERRSANIWFFAAAVISYGLAYLFHLWPQVQVLAAKVFYLAGVPFVVIVPVLSLLLCKAPLQEDVVKKV